jgi:hypothetical protein
MFTAYLVYGAYNSLIDVLEIHYSRSSLYSQYPANSQDLCQSSDSATHYTMTVVLIKVKKNLAAAQPQRLTGVFSDRPIGDCSP